MLSFEDALALVTSEAAALEAETVALKDAAGRVLAADVTALLTQPPEAVSAMDGYAVGLDAPLKAGEAFRVIGEAPAGAPFPGRVGPGEAVRIFTGSVVPAGANHVVIQENTERDGDAITLTADQPVPENVRPAGGDFSQGDVLAAKGERLSPARLGLIAAGNRDRLRVTRRPRIALFANGDELHEPGGELPPGHIVNSGASALTAMIEGWGAEVRYLGIAGDRSEAVEAMFDAAGEADIVVPVGGASVGDHDHVKPVGRARFDLAFEKVAMRPGKPVWYGVKGSQRVLGFPGNPASALSCAILFLRPLIGALSGERLPRAAVKAVLGRDICANGPRDHFMRARAGIDETGRLVAWPASDQDSSLLGPYAAASVLIWRRAGAAPVKTGDVVDVIPFTDLMA